MHSLIKSLVAASLFVSTLALAQPEGEVVITTRDGKARQGRVISETQKGYLFASSKGTSVIPFDRIVDIKQVADAGEEKPTSAPAQTTPPPAPVPAPAAIAQTTPPPPPAPSADFATPPPPPERPAEVSVSEEQLTQRDARKGFHFGLGAFGGITNGGAAGQAQANFEFNFGVPEYRLTANVGMLTMYGFPFVNVSVDNLFQLNLGDVYAIAAGAQVGVVFGAITSLYLAPVLQPVIIRLGEHGQHRLSLSGSIAVVSTASYAGSAGYISWAGSLQVVAGYSFYF